MDLQTQLQFVKGIGPARARDLAAKNLLVVADLLYYLPFRYEDRTNIKRIAELVPEERATVIGEVERVRLSRPGRHRPAVCEAEIADGGTERLLVRWFHGERYAERLTEGTRVALFGKSELDQTRGMLAMTQPETESVLPGDGDQQLHMGRVVAVYEAVGGVSTRVFRLLLDRILRQVTPPPDPLPVEIRQQLELPDLGCAIHSSHQPKAGTALELLNQFRTPEQVRLIFDEFFWLECGLALKRGKARMAQGIPFPLDDRIRERIKAMLPFKPTAAQRRVMQEIADDMKRTHPMNRLLQGDVGSGKTIVAAQAAVIAIENGYQAALLAPTEILALQHGAALTRYLGDGLGHRVTLLSGSMSAAQKRETKQLIRDGAAQLVIGTHALIEETVEFAKLGLAIIDEQHRFGVRQRFRLREKGPQPHVLVMTATPIPRTLALTIYGDLDVSTIDELPPGRQTVVTRVVPEARLGQVYRFLREQVNAGRQAYVVYPAIEESEALKSAEEMYGRLAGLFHGKRVGLLHGKLAALAREQEMQRFVSGETSILVTTTVIEVGVDVPNATVMVIEQAERFGLSQLHQLRGRVGRGIQQSYCILVSGGRAGEAAAERLATLVQSNDGFFISEMDLKLRGPGEFFGTRQSGLPVFRVANLIRDADVWEWARDEARMVIAGLKANPAAREFVRYIQDNWQRQYGLVQVG